MEYVVKEYMYLPDYREAQKYLNIKPDDDATTLLHSNVIMRYQVNFENGCEMIISLYAEKPNHKNEVVVKKNELSVFAKAVLYDKDGNVLTSSNPEYFYADVPWVLTYGGDTYVATLLQGTLEDDDDDDIAPIINKDKEEFEALNKLITHAENEQKNFTEELADEIGAQDFLLLSRRFLVQAEILEMLRNYQKSCTEAYEKYSSRWRDYVVNTIMSHDTIKELIAFDSPLCHLYRIWLEQPDGDVIDESLRNTVDSRRHDVLKDQLKDYGRMKYFDPCLDTTPKYLIILTPSTSNIDYAMDYSKTVPIRDKYDPEVTDVVKLAEQLQEDCGQKVTLHYNLMRLSDNQSIGYGRVPAKSPDKFYEQIENLIDNEPKEQEE